MRGRLRGVLLWQIFRTIRQRAQPDSRVDAVVEFRITGPDPHQRAGIARKEKREHREVKRDQRQTYREYLLLPAPLANPGADPVVSAVRGWGAAR